MPAPGAMRSKAQMKLSSIAPDNLSGAWIRFLRIPSRQVRGITARRRRWRWPVNHLLRRQPALIPPLPQPRPPVLDRVLAVHPSVRLPVVKHRGTNAGRQSDLHRVGFQLRSLPLEDSRPLRLMRGSALFSQFSSLARLRRFCFSSHQAVSFPSSAGMSRA